MNDLISRQAAIEAFYCKDELIVGGEANARNVVNYINKVVGKIENLPAAQPYTINSDGRLWITVDDIDKVTAVVVDEHKSKFCKQFYVDAEPEIIRCKDCRWKDGSECVRFADVRPFPNDFCSRAERRTDD